MGSGSEWSRGPWLPLGSSSGTLCTLCYGLGMPLDVVLVTATGEGISLPSQHGEIAHVWISKGSGEGKAVLEPPLTLI